MNATRNARPSQFPPQQSRAEKHVPQTRCRTPSAHCTLHGNILLPVALHCFAFLSPGKIESSQALEVDASPCMTPSFASPSLISHAIPATAAG